MNELIPYRTLHNRLFISRKQKEREVLQAKLNEKFEVQKLEKKALQESERFGINLKFVADPKKQIIKFSFSDFSCGNVAFTCCLNNQLSFRKAEEKKRLVEKLRKELEEERDRERQRELQRQLEEQRRKDEQLRFTKALIFPFVAQRVKQVKFHRVIEKIVFLEIGVVRYFCA